MEIQKIGSFFYQHFQPGLLLFKNVLSTSQQVSLGKKILVLGERHRKGFWKTNEDGTKVLNSRNGRGRMFLNIHALPEELSELQQKIADVAAKVDNSLKPVKATHAIVLKYNPDGMIPWHQDNGKNDGDLDYPVVSFSLGDSCDFLVNNEKPTVSKENPKSNPKNIAHRILFESGDVLVFGGPSRLIRHAIYHIRKDTAPSSLSFIKGRLNITCRYTPDLIGEEGQFEIIPPNLPKDNPFYKL